MKRLLKLMLLVIATGILSHQVFAAGTAPQSGSRTNLEVNDLSTATSGIRTARLEQPASSASSEVKLETFEPGKTLAIVGGYPIFYSDMSMEISQILDSMLRGAPENVVQAQRPMMEQELTRRLLPKYIDAKRMYVDVISNLPAEADLDKIFESAGQQFDENVLPYIKKQSGVVSTAEFDAQLRIQGSSLRLMRKSWTENELVKYMTKEKIDADPEVTRADLLKYYADHKNEMAVEAKARWEQIMVRFDRFESRTEAKRELAKLGNKIVNGAAFEAMARKHSQGINADEGGQYDWTVKGSLVATELDKAVFELPLNELSDIIETNVGYHIVRVIERQEAGFIPFVEAQSEIREKIVEQKREEAFQAHLSKLRENIPVEILIEEE